VNPAGVNPARSRARKSEKSSIGERWRAACTLYWEEHRSFHTDPHRRRE
jgi:hypothetical protein